MDADEVWRHIDQQRADLADFLETLSDEQWATPSLCDGWTVRDVAAHLTLQQLTLGQGLRALLRHRAGPTRLTLEMARERAAAPTGELVAAIRAMVGSRRHNVGVTFH